MSEDTRPQERDGGPDGLAPETHNSEQDDHDSQAQEIAEEARGLTPAVDTPTESTKGPGDSGLMDDSTQDLVDHMKDMEQSGRIDMDAYRGEPNFDDEDDTYGKGHDPDEDEEGDTGYDDGDGDS